MEFQPKALLVGLGLVAATVWTVADLLPEPPAAPTIDARATAPLPALQPVSLEESLSPNEQLVTLADAQPAAATAPRPVHPAPPPASRPKAVVKRPAPRAVAVNARAARAAAAQRRAPGDENLRLQVVDALGRTPSLHGAIAVESRESVVRLSGYTITAGQAHRAGRAAASVPGVKRVQNDLRPRLGG